MSTEESPAPSATTVADLQQQVEELKEIVEAQQERIDELEAQPTIEMDDNVLGTLRVENVPLGKIVKNKPGESEVESMITEIGGEPATDGGLDHVSERVRNRMLPIHQMWTDVKGGNSDHLGAMDRRAAHLFGEFISAAAGNGSPAVDTSYNTYSMSSTDAGEFLKGVEPDNTSIASSQTIKRVFEAFTGKTKVEDGDDPVFDHDNENGTRTLAVDKQRFEALMKNVQAAIDGEVTVGGTDDSGHSDEAAADAKARKKLDEMERGSR